VGLLEPDARYGGGVEQDDVMNDEYYTIDYGKRLKEAFPDFSCQRCGSTGFTILAPAETLLFDRLVKAIRAKGNRELSEVIASDLDFKNNASGMFATVVCNKCGFSERYFAPLFAASKE
jgi:predicted nucleic-acid-binding Zn-ribbon protein